MRIFCLLGLHNWEYVTAILRMPGGLRRICLRCAKPEYNPGFPE